MKIYDVIVVGAGSAGLGSSGVAAALGLKTLIIEKKAENVGGDCLNFGCVPSKAIIHVAKIIHQAKQAHRFGVQTSGNVDFEKVMAYIHEKQDIIRAHESVDYLKDQGFDVVIGTAKFSGRKELTVNGEKYQAKLIFLCTGSKPRMLQIPGMENIDVHTNESLFYEMKKLPRHLIVIGGGPIGCEMAQAFRRLGSEVTIVNRGERLLSKESEVISNTLQNILEEEGIVCHMNATVSSIDSDKNVFINSSSTKKLNKKADAILLAVGRIVRTEGMELSNGGVELTKKGRFKVNEYLQSTNKRVYVLGDASGKYMFSHGAEKQVRLAWRNVMMPFWKKKDRVDNLSWVTFTEPQVATFGLSESEMHEQGIDFWRQDQDFKEDDRAIVDEYRYGQMSLYFNKDASIANRQIIGGTMIAPNAGELMQEMELAAAAEISIKTIFDRVYPYPVAARINQKTVRGLYERSFSSWKKKLAKRFFKMLY